MDNSAEHYLRLELKEAIRLLRKQKERLLYSMDEQLKTEKQVTEFLKRYE